MSSHLFNQESPDLQICMSSSWLAWKKKGVFAPKNMYICVYSVVHQKFRDDSKNFEVGIQLVFQRQPALGFWAQKKGCWRFLHMGFVKTVFKAFRPATPPNPAFFFRKGQHHCDWTPRTHWVYWFHLSENGKCNFRKTHCFGGNLERRSCCHLPWFLQNLLQLPIKETNVAHIWPVIMRSPLCRRKCPSTGQSWLGSILRLRPASSWWRYIGETSWRMIPQWII